VTEETHIETRLAGTFFFSRRHTKRRTTGYFFATLAYQLATNFPSIRTHVNRAIFENPALLDPDKSVRDQMEGLFLRALRNLQGRLRGSPPLTFVIDALDECTSETLDQHAFESFNEDKSESELAELISLLAQALRDPELPITHILVTSRSEGHIREAMQNNNVRPLVGEIPVNISGEGVATTISLDGADVDEDIFRFLEDSFSKLQLRYSTFLQPTKAQLERLASRAGRRFIVATTMMKFIDDRHNDPRDRLELMLELTSQLLPGTEVYKLYDLILSTCAEPTLAYMHLSVVAVLADPLPISQISELLGPGQGRDVGEVLMQLRSVIDLPTNSSLPVNIYHSSVRDYVSHRSNCSLRQVHYITSPHSLLASSSLHLMVREIPASMALLDALSELKKHSQAMQPQDPQNLKHLLSFMVQPPEPMQVLVTLLWLRGNYRSELQFWLDTPDGCAWLQSEGVKDWLPTQGRMDWLLTDGGKEWLRTQGARDWLQMEAGHDWLHTDAAREWLLTDGGKEWLQTQDARDWLQTEAGRGWLQTMTGQDWLQTTTGRYWLRTYGKEWLGEKAGQDWLQTLLQTGGEEKWLWTEAGRDWLQTTAGRDWLKTTAGRDWLQTGDGHRWLWQDSKQDWLQTLLQTDGREEWFWTEAGQDWLQTMVGRDWLKTTTGRNWLKTDDGHERMLENTEQDWLQTLLQTDGREDWLWTEAGQDWLQTMVGQDWLKTTAGRNWLKTDDGHEWMLENTEQDWLKTWLQTLLQTNGREEWLWTEAEQDWLQTTAGRDWLQTDYGQDWLQTQDATNWLKTESGQDWLQTLGARDWLEKQDERNRLQTESGKDCNGQENWLWTQGQDWPQSETRRDWQQSGGRKLWLTTQAGRAWLQTEAGRDWLQTEAGKDWLQTIGQKDWLWTQAGQDWLQRETGRDWLKTETGQDWLRTHCGKYWLQCEDGQHWLQTQGARDWLETESGRDWLQTQDARDWLQKQDGQDWLKTPRGRAWRLTTVWVTMEDFSSTSEAIREYTISPELSYHPPFQAIQQFSALPDYLMFPVFLALRQQAHSTTALPDMAVIHAMKTLSIVADEAQKRSRSASGALNYACQNWAVHLSRTPKPWDHRLAHTFQSFWNRNLLSWLERQWCLKDLPSCLTILSEGEKLAKVLMFPVVF
jgi:hypothetical protein